ncbi:hypothetical protein XBJ2_1300094 [Xenorhabdus bovienii str. Jollieti]|nr:hypothetical protein XBJ2_1300094 [Xenorhabdus bovienii str. Jollieti]
MQQLNAKKLVDHVQDAKKELNYFPLLKSVCIKVAISLPIYRKISDVNYLAVCIASLNA